MLTCNRSELIDEAFRRLRQPVCIDKIEQAEQLPFDQAVQLLVDDTMFWNGAFHGVPLFDDGDYGGKETAEKLE